MKGEMKEIYKALIVSYHCYLDFKILNLKFKISMD